MQGFSFNATEFQPNYGGNAEGGLPPGKHKVILESADLTPSSKNPQNSYLKFKLKCIEGLAQGGVQIDRINVFNNDQTAVRIASQQLAAYCAVMGKRGFTNVSELFNIPFWIEVRPQRDNPQYTEVATYYDLQGNQPGAAPAAQVGQQTQAPPQGFSAGPAPAAQPVAAQPWSPPGNAAPAVAIDPAPAQQWSPPAAENTAAPWAPAGGGGTAPGWSRT